MGVPRPTWSPDDRQKAILDALGRLAKRREAVEAEIWKLVDQAHELDVPITHIADRAAVERKTVYRHLGRPMR